MKVKVRGLLPMSPMGSTPGSQVIEGESSGEEEF
jgi:hypothetical protein